jgi:hypothetical protein
MYTDRPSPDEYGGFYAGYIDAVPPGDLISLLLSNATETTSLLSGLNKEQADRAYAPGKWTIKELLGHLSDTERVMSYRALRIARGDSTPLPGYEQDPYVTAGRFGARPLVDLIEEFEAVRRASITLFRSFDDDAWLRRGTASGHPISVRALGCIIIGHENHHRTVLVQRYFGD